MATALQFTTVERTPSPSAICPSSDLQQKHQEAARLLALLDDRSGAWHSYPKPFPTVAVDDAFRQALASGRIEIDRDLRQFRVRTHAEVAEAQHRRRRHRREQRLEDQLVERQRLWQASNVPPRFRAADLRELHGVPAQYRRAASAVLELLRSPGLTALVGPTGVGKTEIGAGAAREFCRRGQPAVFIGALAMFTQLKTTYQRDSARSEGQVLQSLASPRLLVIDELDSRDNSEWEALRLEYLINARYQDCASTLLISNLPPEDLAQCLGPRVVSRLQQTGRIVACEWESFRTNGKSRKSDGGMGWTPVRAGAWPTDGSGPWTNRTLSKYPAAQIAHRSNGRSAVRIVYNIPSSAVNGGSLHPHPRKPPRRRLPPRAGDPPPTSGTQGAAAELLLSACRDRPRNARRGPTGSPGQISIDSSSVTTATDKL